MTPALVIALLTAPVPHTGTLGATNFAPSGIEAPAPKIAGQPKPPLRWHAFYDRQAKVTLAVELSLNAFDQAQTCHNLATGGREYNLPTQHCTGVVALNVGFLAAGEGLAYLLHRMGHHRLERVPRWYLIYGNVYGIAYSKAHGAL